MNTLEELLKRIENSQYEKTEQFEISKCWFNEKGFFPMDIHINFCGDETMTNSRRNVKIPDGNGFLTNFVVQCLLESEKFGFVKPNNQVISNAVEATFNCLNKNDLNKRIYGFWSQFYNDDFGIYIFSSMNLKYIIENVPNLTTESIGKLFKTDGYSSNKLKKVLEYLKNKKDMKLSIPSDTDCTCINIVMGEILSNFKDSIQYGDAYESWIRVNENVEMSLNSICQNCYSPFSDDPNNNSVDPRSFFFLKDFINDWVINKKRNKEELMIPFTYFLSLDEQIKYFPEIQIPSLSNHIELSVVSNVLFSILSAIKCYGLKILDLINIKFILKSIVFLLEYSIKTNLIFDRADILLLYYPSVYSFLWFVSRSNFILKELKLKENNNFPLILEEILIVLNDIGENEVTNKLIDRLIIDQNQQYYWEDFLGNSDVFKSEPIKYGEDRFFCTSLVINTLIDNWTIPIDSSSYKRSFKEITPNKIKSIIKKSSLYVSKSILNEDEKLSNVFFSEASKGRSTKIMDYPSNIKINANNGNIVKSDFDLENLKSKKQLIVYFSGIIEEENYKKLLNEKKTIEKWNGNFNENPFIYWSSPIFTYSISLLALSKFKSLFE
ncbi:hypothetical protein ACTA71_000942 [Dictyostelium dimigraforme]